MCPPQRGYSDLRREASALDIAISFI